MVIAMGAAAPAPRPWTILNAISDPMLHAAAARIDPSRNRVTPRRMIGLRPTVSASLE